MSNFASKEIRTMSLSDLNPAPYNPRDRLDPNSDKYKMLRQSLMEYGNVQPIVVNVHENRNVIVGGHQRYWILHEDLGYTDDKVVVVDLEENMEIALNIALNTPAGQYDPDKYIAAALRLEADNLLSVAQLTVDDVRNAEMLRSSDDYSATDFLMDEDIEKTIATKATVGAAELKDDHPHRTGEQLFTMQMVFTGEQRETVMAAINAAKESYALDTTMEAIVAICQQFLIDQGMG